MKNKINQPVVEKFNSAELEAFCNRVIEDVKADNEPAIFYLFETCPACKYANHRMMEEKGYSQCQHCPIDTIGKPGFTFWDNIDETFYNQEFPYCYLIDFYHADSKVRKLQVLEQFAKAKIK